MYHGSKHSSCSCCERSGESFFVASHLRRR
jgi:hypothetical protein